MSWNPSATGTIGNEWRAWNTGSLSPDPVAVYVNSSATETIDSLIVPFRSTGAPQSYGRLWAEVYNATDLGVNETPVVSTYTPNEDVAVSGVYYTAVGGASTGPISGGASNIDQYIDDTTDESYPLSAVDYLTINTGATGKFAFGSSGLGAGRVLSISIEVRYQSRHSTTGVVGVDLYNGPTLLLRAGSLVTAQAGQDQVPTLSTVAIGPIYINPLTGEPWSRTDIINMDTGTDLMVQLTGLSGSVVVLAMRLKVSMISEKRVAMGGNTPQYVPTTNLETANVCSLKTPALVDNWAKAAATDYVIVVRRLLDPKPGLPFQTFSFPWVESGSPNPHDQGHGYGVTVDAAGRITATTGLQTRAHGLIMAINTSNNLSADSQVYHSLYAAALISGAPATQQFSNAASTNYLTVRAIIGVYNDPALQPSIGVTFKVKRQSDNTQMGGTATLTAAQLGEHHFLGVQQDIAWYDVQLNLSSAATLVSGTQYYLEISTTSVDTTRYWFARVLNYAETHSFGVDQSYGGSTDHSWVQTQSDMTATLTTTPPTAPASITVTEHDVALPTAGDPKCAPGVHQTARVAWAATSDPTQFARYEVQRSEDGGTTWTLIKRVATEATVTFDDVEAARGVALAYRVREVRTNGQVSDWRTQTGTLTLAANTASVIFASNAFPALTVGYVNLGSEHDYQFLSDNNVSVVEMHERPLNVMFRPTEDRGVGYAFTLLIHSKQTLSDDNLIPAGGKAAAAFGPLRAIVEAATPYVAVFTPDGDRLYAGVRLPSGHRTEPAAYYATTVTLVQVASSVAVTDL